MPHLLLPYKIKDTYTSDLNLYTRRSTNSGANHFTGIRFCKKTRKILAYINNLYTSQVKLINVEIIVNVQRLLYGSHFSDRLFHYSPPTFFSVSFNAFDKYKNLTNIYTSI